MKLMNEFESIETKLVDLAEKEKNIKKVAEVLENLFLNSDKKSRISDWQLETQEELFKNKKKDWEPLILVSTSYRESLQV